jgi:hypothetical protein
MDGGAGSTSVGRHVAACAACGAKADALRAAARWIETVAEPGPDCLSADAMAAAIEGGPKPAHLELCPRCAAEFKALRPAKKATRRLRVPRASWTPWIAAAAALLVAAVGLALLRERKPERTTTAVVPPKAQPREAEPETEFALPPRERLIVPMPPPPPPPPLREPAVEPAPEPKAPETDPAPEPKLPEPPPAPPAPPTPRTVVEAPRKAVALNVKTGGLSTQRDGRWVKSPKIEEGLPVRAEGRTVCEFAGANVTIEASSKVEFQGFDLALHEGALSAEVAPGASFALTLDTRRVEPVAVSSRVLLVARPDRVVVEEGAAKVGASLLKENVEYVVRKDRLESKKGRSLPAAARPRETLTWKLDFSQPAQLRPRIGAGRLVIAGGERMLAAERGEDAAGWQSRVGYHSGDRAVPLFTVKPGTTLRFRYYLSQPAELELVMWNQSKEENFNKPLESVAGRWTTVTIPVRDVAPNRGGKQAPCEVGDKYISWGLFCGVMVWANMTHNYSSDYNGYRPNKGVAAQFSWMAPEPGVAAAEPGRGSFKNFATLAEFQSATGQEKHAREVDFDIFESMTPPNPATRYAVYHAMDLNFRLKPGSKAIDAAVALPTVNDGFTGSAPDLGALESGKPEPHYGPRWLTWKPFYR